LIQGLVAEILTEKTVITWPGQLGLESTIVFPHISSASWSPSSSGTGHGTSYIYREKEEGGEKANKKEVTVRLEEELTTCGTCQAKNLRGCCLL
jgi:hypothetical protein